MQSAPLLEPGARLELRVERPGAQGRGVARHAGFTVLVERGLPGETVLAQVLRVEPRYAVARVVQVLEPAPGRVEAPCPHFAACGGCDWQHLAYPAQLALKQQVVEEQLQRIGGMQQIPAWSVQPAPAALEYRSKLEFMVLDGAHMSAQESAQDSAGLVPGFHGFADGPPEPVQAPAAGSAGGGCRLAPPVFTALAARALALLAEQRTGVKPVRVTVQDGELPAGGLALALTLHVAPRELDRAADRLSRTDWLAALRQEFPAVAAVALAALSPAAARRDTLDGDAGPLRLLAGEPLLLRRVGSWRYWAPLGGFFQVHAAQTQALLQHVLGQITAQVPVRPGLPPPLVLDLYCGAGLFALPLAARGYRVLGADQSPLAVRAARQSAREGAALNGGEPAGPQVRPTRAQFKAANLDQSGALEHLLRGEGAPDGAVLDPPRRGLSPALIQGLLAAPPRVLVYVSCDGGTFARDLARLSGAYTLATLAGFDLFPQTRHVELAGTLVAHGG